MLRLCRFCMAGLSAVLASPVLSQGVVAPYPSRQVLIVVPQAPGGPGDRETRLYAGKMSELLGQQFIVDFKGGAGTTLGTGYVAKAAPDGHTLLVATGAFTTFPAFYKNLGFDNIKDFAPISLMSRRTSVLIVHPSFPAKTFADYLNYAKTNPGKINFGTSGAGGAGHLAGAWMHSATNTKVTFVHYKGTGALLPDLYSGRLDVTPAGFLVALPLIKSNKVRPLAILNIERSKLLPDIPTVAEQGIPGYDYKTWQGYVAPAATSAAIVNKLSQAFAKVAKMPDVARPLAAEGNTLVGSTPAEFKQLIISETNLWREVVQKNGIALSQ